MSYLLGLDRSGNNNNFTVNNITLADQMLDTPTNNFATLNPLGETSDVTYSEGNLKFANGGSTVWDTVLSTMGISSGKWYFEIVQTGSTPDNDLIGFANIQDMNNNLDQHIGNISTGWGIYAGGTPVSIYNNGSSIGTITGSSTWATNDVIMLTLDMDNGEAWWGKNGTWWNSGVPASRTNPQVSSITGTIGVGGSCYQSGHNQIWNFGQDSSFAGNKTAQGNQDSNGIGDFFYEPPNSFLALCSSNLPDVAVVPSEHFNTVLYSGNATAQRQITGVGFQPSWTWIKSRSGTFGAYPHFLFDAVRGVGKQLQTNSSSVEATNLNNLYSFDSDGFSLGQSAQDSVTNGTSTEFVSWNWKANGSGSANTNGDINSTVSANVDAGFSIVGYTGTGSTATVGHGLSKAPEMMIIRSREVLDNWLVFANAGSMDATDGMYLDSTGAKLDSDTFFNDTAPTNSLFTVKSHSTCNTNTKPYIAYCFHSVDGYSAVGSYSGNSNADGSFVYLGFRPKWVLIKRTNSTGHWKLFDSARSTFNLTNKYFNVNDSDAEATSAANALDFTSNGFKLRSDYGDTNVGTYIYIAFAETPFKYSNAR